MDMSILHPMHTYQASKPIKVTPRGNMYKINVAHFDENGTNVRNTEIWTTKEAVKQHLGTTDDDLHDYQFKRFARQTYENQLRKHEGNLHHQGILVTTDSVSHGNPQLWPSTLSHPEIKL